MVKFKQKINWFYNIIYIYSYILKDDGNQEEAEKDDEDDIRCNDSNMTTDVTDIVTPNQDNSRKV